MLVGALAVLSVSAWTFETSALAAGGDLDPTFGDGGLVASTEFFEGLAGGSRIAFQPDGRIVVAGYLYPGEEHTVFAVARFEVSGLPDPTFSGDGIASTTFHADEGCDEEARSVVVQADGRIVAVGVSSCPSPGGGDGTFAIARYGEDGAPDPTFGDNGTVMTGFGDPEDCSAHAESVALDPQGAIVVAGTMDCTKAGIDSRFAIARYATDGSLDSSFSDDGRVTTNFTPQYDKASDVAVQSDGKVVVSGTAAYWIVEIPDALPSRAALVRYELDGTLDPTFGGDGRVMTSFRSRRCPGSNESYGLAIQPDGMIVEGGSAACAAEARGVPHPRWALARYRPDGTLDPAFGGDGRVVSIFSDITWGDWMSAGIAIQSDGKIVAAGSTCRSNPRFALARYRPSGRLDRAFGDDGRVRTVFGTGRGCAQGGWGGLGIQGDGKIVVSGGGGCLKAFAMARFLPS